MQGRLSGRNHKAVATRASSWGSGRKGAPKCSGLLFSSASSLLELADANCLPSSQTLCPKFCDLSGPKSNLKWDEGGYGGVRERHWYLMLRQCPPAAPVFTVSWLRSPPSLGMTVIPSPPSVSHSSPLTHSAPHFRCCSPTLRGFTLLQSSQPPSESGRAARAWSCSALALTYPIIPLSFSTSSCRTLSLIPFQQNPTKQWSILTTSSSSLPVLISIFSLTFHF